MQKTKSWIWTLLSAVALCAALFGFPGAFAAEKSGAPDAAQSQSEPSKTKRGAKAGARKAKRAPVLTPGGIWMSGDKNRPRPRVVTPGTCSAPDQPGRPPSDALVLFNGEDLSHWSLQPKGQNDPSAEAPKWKIENGYMEIAPRTGDIVSKEKFGDCQIHLEWATPSEVKGAGQGRGNSGVYLVGHCEIQVLDSYNNDTYPDGQAAALYHLYPPLVNASRKPGEWQTYDAILIQPRLDKDGKVVKPACLTLFHNGVLVHHAVELPGDVTESPILLQDHNNPVRYRNIWVRNLKGYDEP